MKKLKEEQKKYLIEMGQKFYKIGLEIRIGSRDPWVPTRDINRYLKESCQSISSLIYYIAKEEYKVPDKDNKIIHCIIKVDGKLETSHYINSIYGTYVDASIEQFNYDTDLNLSPYDNNGDYYSQLKECEPLGIEAIQHEYDAYGFDWLMKIEMKKKTSIFKRVFGKRKIK